MDEETNFELEVIGISGSENISDTISQTACLKNSTGQQVICQSGLLPHDSYFKFTIVSFNTFGKSMIDPIMIS